MLHCMITYENTKSHGSNHKVDINQLLIKGSSNYDDIVQGWVFKNDVWSRKWLVWCYTCTQSHTCTIYPCKQTHSPSLLATGTPLLVIVLQVTVLFRCPGLPSKTPYEMLLAVKHTNNYSLTVRTPHGFHSHSIWIWIQVGLEYTEL